MSNVVRIDAIINPMMARLAAKKRESIHRLENRRTVIKCDNCGGVISYRHDRPFCRSCGLSGWSFVGIEARRVLETEAEDAV